jgi:hypothetical protein
MSRPPAERTELDRELAPQYRRRAIRLELLTAGRNAVEGVVAIAAGIGASSIALVGFGLDSFVEVSAASVRDLVTQPETDASTVGIVLTAVSLAVMPPCVGEASHGP